MNKNRYEILIIGAGPAGLSAAWCCMLEGIDFIVIENGLEHSDRSKLNPKDVPSGVGGAGLYSDGKLSYYPSSHALWALPSESILRNAFNYIHNLISDFSPNFPKFPDIIHNTTKIISDIENDFIEKRYCSLLMSQEEQQELLNRLVLPIRHKILTNSRVEKIDKIRSGYEVSIIKSDDLSDRYTLETKQIIFCGGRFGPLALKEMLLGLPFIFQRFEYGVRIEQSKANFFLKDWPTVDAKILFRSNDRNTEWRTFCCCREGAIIRCEFKKHLILSGTYSKNSPSSNIGFNVRILDHDLYKEVSHEFQKMDSGDHTFKVPFDEFIENDKTEYFGTKLDSLLKDGLRKLQKRFDLTNAFIHGPCFEGVGHYPRLSSNLESKYDGMFVAGDSTGLFRGLLPALISGYYVSKQACLKRFEGENHISTNVSINKSSTNRLPQIFTAQSKKFFYCRDAICEFVFKQGKLPINPFRVFDYFLSDRVPREIIRQGNNHLVNSCDELWVFGPIADGVLFEVIYAININKPIRFFNIATRSNEIISIKNIENIKFEPEVHSSGQKRTNLLKEIQRSFRNYKKHEQLELPFEMK